MPDSEEVLSVERLFAGRAEAKKKERNNHESSCKVYGHGIGLAAGVGLTGPALAQEADGPILFTNVNVFDGVNETLIRNYSLK